MSLFLKSAVAVLALTFQLNACLAEKVNLSGTHSRGEIKRACKGVGTYHSTEGGSYGCINGEKGTSIKCSSDGKCTGSVPQ